MRMLLATMLLLASLPAMADSTAVESLYLQGVAAYKVQNYPLAIQLFDEVIAAHPAHAGARLDKAISQYEQGDLDAARAGFNELANLPDVPPQITELVQHYLEALAPPLAWYWQQSAGVAAGRSNNANQGLSRSRFDFGELDPYYLARPDNYAELQYQAEAQRLSDNHRRYVMLYQRQWQTETDANQALVLGGASWQWPRAYGTVHFHGQLGQSFQGNNALYRMASSSLAWQQPLLSGQLWLRGGVQQKQYPNDAANSNRVWQLGVSYRLPLAWQQWQIDFSLAKDQARGARPGGDRHRGEVALRAQWLLSQQLKLQADISWRQEQQSQIFSPLFAGIRRQDTTLGQGLQLQWHLPARQQLSLGWLHQQQRSNIPLYTIRQQEWQLGWQKSW